MVVRRPKIIRKPDETPTRVKAAKIGSNKTSSRPPKTATLTGDAGFDAAERQQKKQQDEYERRKEKPFSFRITQEDMTKGRNEVELLYLDTEPFFVRLHTVKNARGGFDDEVCIADTGEICPLCTSLGKEGSYTLMLTALDKRAYRNREGVLIRISKKLVPVKSRNIAKFQRQWKRHGTFRGLIATHRRHGAKEASIGEDIEFKEKLVPEVIIKKTTKGKEDLMHSPNFAKVFPTPTAEQLRERYGTGPLSSSNDDSAGDDEGISWG